MLSPFAFTKKVAAGFEIKCKATGDNYQSEAQKKYQRQIENAGGVYLIVTTFEDFYNWFNHKKVKK